MMATGARLLHSVWGEFDGLRPCSALIATHPGRQDLVETLAIYCTKPPTWSNRAPQERHLFRCKAVPNEVRAAFLARPGTVVKN